MIEIAVATPGSQQQLKSFSSSRIRIGRDEDNDLVLDDKSSSRHHAEIVEEKGSYRIVDLGSANGVRIGGAKVADAPITDGLVVKLGETVLTFSLPSSALDGTILLPNIADGTILLSKEQVLAEAAAAAAPPAAAAHAAPGAAAATSSATAAPPPSAASPASAAAATPPPEPLASPPGVLYLNYRERQEQKSFKVAGGVEYVIGRSPNADLTLNDKKSSKRHAMIFSRDGRFFVRDLGSANKTFVNGDPVEESVLAPGDELRIGSAVFHASDQRVAQDDQEFLLARTQLGLPSAELLAQIGAGPAPAAAPPRRSRATLAIVGVVAALALGAALYWLSTRDGAAVDAVEAASAAMRVQVAPVIAKDLDAVVSSTGTIKAERTATVSSEVPGRVLEVAVDVGQRVERGQQLARLNDRDVRLQIQEARSSLTPEQVAIARDDYDRKKRLFESGVVTRSMFDQSKNAYLALESSYKSLQAKVGLLEEQLAKATVVAPMTGIVAQRMVSAGEVVGPGTPLFVVDAMDEVLLEAELSDRDIVKIQQGQQVEVTSDAFRGRTFAGRVEIIGSAANPITKTFLVQARIPNTDLALRSGMIASMRIVLASSKGLVVPADALIGPPEDGAAEVWVVSEGVARRAPVRIGQQLDREIEVLEGLREGDSVVVYGKERLTDGAAVETYRERQPGS